MLSLGTGANSFGNANRIFLDGDNNAFSVGEELQFDSNGLRISGSAVTFNTPTFFLGSDSQFVSGSNNNIEISSSNFHLDNAGNVVMSGDITATQGSIGGFQIGSEIINSGGSTLRLKGSSGQITASAAQITGKITATSGEIGDFDIVSTGISKETVDGANQVSASFAPTIVQLSSRNTTNLNKDQIQLINVAGKQEVNLTSQPSFNSSDRAKIKLLTTSNASASSATFDSTFGGQTMGIQILAGSLKGEQLIDSAETSVARLFVQNSIFPNSGKLTGKKNLQTTRGGNFQDNDLPSGSGILIEASERQNLFFAGFEKDAFLTTRTTSNGSSHFGHMEIYTSGSSGVFHLGRGQSTANRGLFETTGSRHEDILLSGQMDVNTETIDITTQATDIDLIDNNASALSFDSTGRSGIMEVITTNNAEKVKFGGLGGIQVEANITANGNIVGDGSTSLSNMVNGTFSGTVQAEQITSTDDITAAGDLDVGGTYTNNTQPAFLAYNSSVDSNRTVDTDHKIEFDTEVYDQANNFDNSTDTFTAPVTGKYLLSVQVRLDDIDKDANWVNTKIVTSNREYRRFIDPVGFDTNVDHFGMHMTVVADMDANDTAHIIVRQSGGSAILDIEPGNPSSDQIDTFFSGYLLG